MRENGESSPVIFCSRKVHDKKEMKGGVVVATRKDSRPVSSTHLIHSVDTDEGSHRRRVLPRLLDERIGEIEPLLEERDAPHPFSWRSRTSSTSCMSPSMDVSTRIPYHVEGLQERIN